MKRAGQGFSLIELMVALAILALALVALMPDVSGWVRNIRLRATAESIQNGLQRAREEALRRNTPVMFSLVTTSTANPNQLDITCAQSATGPGWVVSLMDPSKACNAAIGGGAPYIVATYAPNNATANTPVIAATNTNAGTATIPATSVTFDYLGNVVNPGKDITTINVTYAATVATDVPLEIQIAPSGGVVRMCNPTVAVTTPPDPRACL